MTDYPIRTSETGAAAARFAIGGSGRPHVLLYVPTGAGRRLRLELSLGSARSIADALTQALADADAAIPRKPEPR